ncbi:MAG: DUF481 domain-containing protein [Desulfuromonadaceae bacterium]|nr:DUF481 domain-containing protein [Desulfuromonadaceae bacterium]MDD2849818.1 DUF481 domain-containing protein [Desulfuromonadaceae bacterium]MDD4129326.1 DUF481 domain-containing protein [Desulfuromonadaceae bacterium]
MKNKCFFIFSLFLLFGLSQGSSFADEVHFTNGDSLKGVLKKESTDEIVFESENLGVLTLSKDRILTVNRTPLAHKPLPEEKVLEVEWTRQIEASFLLKNGNTVAKGLGGKFTINRKREKVDEWTLQGRASYATEEKKMSAQAYYGLLRYAWSLGEAKKWYQFNKIEADHDYFANIRSRYTPATGLGYWFFDHEPFKALLEGGLGVQRTDFRHEKNDTTEVIVSSRAFFDWRIQEKLHLSQEFLFYPYLTDFGEYRFRSETSLKIPIYTGLSFRSGLVDEYQSNPGGDTLKNDIRLESSLAYSF